MLRVKGEGLEWLNAALSQLRAKPGFGEKSLPDLINQMIASGHEIRVWYIHGHWLDVNSLADLERAGDFTAGHD